MKNENKNKDQKKMMLSETLVEILWLLNEFGFCEIRHVIKRFNIKKSSAYDYMKILLQYKLVMNVRVIQYQPRAYVLTTKGTNLLKFEFPILHHIPLHIYEHQLDVIDVYLKLREVHPNAVWLSERRLARDQYANANLKNNEHLPDGALLFPEGHQCAIEIEKSLKARKRLEEILLSYGLQQTYKEAWYFCSKSTLPVLNSFAKDMPYIKTYNLSEFIK